VRGPASALLDRNPEDLVSLKELERQHILEVLRSVGGNKALTSRHLGLDRKTLYRKLKEYSIAEERAAAESNAPGASESDDESSSEGDLEPALIEAAAAAPPAAHPSEARASSLES
jgi:hypothetical protein